MIFLKDDCTIDDIKEAIAAEVKATGSLEEDEFIVALSTPVWEKFRNMAEISPSEVKSTLDGLTPQEAEWCEAIDVSLCEFEWPVCIVIAVPTALVAPVEIELEGLITDKEEEKG